MTKASQLLRFVFVGGSTAFLALAMTYSLVEALAVQVTLASTIALVIAVVYNYTMHYHWTFKSDAPHGMVLVKYFAMCLGGVILNALVMHFGVKMGVLHYMFVQLIAAAALVCWSLSISTLWVFR